MLLPQDAYYLSLHLSTQIPPNQSADAESDGSCNQTKQYLPHA
jgi:hypothetical protein